MPLPPDAAPPLDPLEALLLECVEREGAARAIAVDEACRRHPELAARLRERLAWLETTGLASDDAPPKLPERLGEFRLLEPLGSGGMGVVWLAEQETLGRRVALKLIRTDQQWFPGSRERFEREVRAVAQLKHPNIVPIYAVGTHAGVPYFAMEWLEGATLAELIHELAGRKPGGSAARAPAELAGRDAFELLARRARTPRDPAAALPELFAGTWHEFACRVARAIADALAHAHAAGVLHRDVKPSNVVVTADGRALLLDFGLASATDSPEITKSGSPLGSLPYMAPEQLRGEALDARADVWSLAATLHELLSFQSPFLAVNAARTAERISRGDAPSLRSPPHRVAWEIDVALRTALEPERERRYANAVVFGDELRRILAHEPILARSPGPLRRLRRLAQRRPALATGLALGTLLFVGLPTTLYLQERSARRRIEKGTAATERSAKRLEEALLAVSPTRSPGADDSTERMLAQVGAQIRNELASEPLERARLLGVLGRVYATRKEPLLAEPFLREAIELEEQAGAGAADRTTLLRILLVESLNALGRRDESAALLDPALESSAAGPDGALHPALVAQRAELRHLAGDAAAAEADFHAAIASLRRIEPGSSYLALALSGLAFVEFEQERFEDALALFVEAQSIESVILPPSHPRIVASGHNIARCLLSLGRNAESDAPSAAALAGFERLYGADSPELVAPLVTRARFERAMHERVAQEALLRRAAGLVRASPELTRPQDAWCLNDLGIFLNETARGTEARAVMAEAIAIGRRPGTLTPRHFAMTLLNAADVESTLADGVDRALALAAEAETVARATTPPARDLLARAACARAWILIGRNDLAGATAALDAGEAELRSLGRDARRVGGLLANLRALVANLRGDGAAGGAFAERSLELLGEEPVAEAPTARYLLGWSWQLRNDVARARAELRASIDRFDELYPSGHLQAAFPLNRLGELLIRDDVATATELFEQAYAIRDRQLSPGDDWLSQSRHNLAAALYVADPRDPRARELFDEEIDVRRPLRRGRDDALVSSLFHAATIRRGADGSADPAELREALALAQECLALLERMRVRDDPWRAKTRTLIDTITDELASRDGQR